MDLRFRTGKLAKTCSEEKVMVKKLGPQVAGKLKLRLAQLEGADTLADMANLPGARCHELTLDRQGQLAVDLAHPYRLLFKPDHNPIPVKPSGGLDWSQVNRVELLEIVDYH